MSTIIQPDPPILPPSDLPEDPFSPPSPKNPIPPLPDLYPTDPPPMPYPETPPLARKFAVNRGNCGPDEVGAQSKI